MEKACNDLGVKIVAYSPLGQGLFAYDCAVILHHHHHHRPLCPGLLTNSLTHEKFSHNRPAKMTGLTWDSLKPLRDEILNISLAHHKTMAQVLPYLHHIPLWNKHAYDSICHYRLFLIGVYSMIPCRLLDVAQVRRQRPHYHYHHHRPHPITVTICSRRLTPIVE